jgi:peptide/nickel transport system substrate-binding protein
MAGEYWQRFWQRRLGRRTFLRAAALGAGAAALGGSLACREQAPQAPPQPAEEGAPKRGGRSQAWSTVTFDQLDPHISVAASTAYFPRVYNTLVSQSQRKPDFFYYDLAETLEQPDAVTYIFRLRPGVRVAPNNLGVPERELDAQDVYLNWERIKNEPRALASRFSKQFLASHAAQDARTYVMRTTEPYAWALYNVGLHVSTIAPRELLTNPDRLRTAGAGGGPFSFGRFVEGEGLSLERNPSYYRKGSDGQPLPYVDGIDVRIIPDRAARRAAFQTRQVHYYTAANVREAQELLDPNNYYLIKEPIFSFMAVTMNADRPPFNDGRVRRAVARSINHDQFINVVHLGDAKVNGLVHWALGDFALPEQELKGRYLVYNPQEARQLLAAAGHPQGLRIKMMYPANTGASGGGDVSQYVPILIENLRAGGIEVEQEPLDFGTWLDRYRRRDYDSSLSLNQVYETAEVPLDWHTSWGPAGDGLSWNIFRDPEIDAAVRRVKQITQSAQELVRAIHEVQRLIYAKDPTFIPLPSSSSNTLWWNFVKNNPGRLGLGVTALFLVDWWLDL